jgi:hypothetical protein
MNMMADKTLHDSIGQFKRQYFFAKAAMFLFNALYLLAGFGMGLISFFVESKVFLSLLGEGWSIAYMAAASLELAKLGTIVVYDFINRNESVATAQTGIWNALKYWMQILFKRSFQVGLFTMSMLCVTIVISEQFDRPQLEETRHKDLGELEAAYQNTRKELLDRQQQEKAYLLQRQNDDRTAIENRYAPLIEAENRGLVVERGRPGRRTREVRGPVYDSHRQMLKEHIDNRDNELANHKATAAAETSQQTKQHTAELVQLRTAYDQNRDAIQHKNYANDQRVEHKAIHAGVETINQAFLVVGAGQKITPTGLVAFISLLLAALFECGIFLSFSSFVGAFFPQEFVVVEQEWAAVQKKTTRPGLNPESTLNT